MDWKIALYLMCFSIGENTADCIYNNPWNSTGLARVFENTAINSILPLDAITADNIFICDAFCKRLEDCYGISFFKDIKFAPNCMIYDLVVTSSSQLINDTSKDTIILPYAKKDVLISTISEQRSQLVHTVSAIRTDTLIVTLSSPSSQLIKSSEVETSVDVASTWSPATVTFLENTIFNGITPTPLMISMFELYSHEEVTYGECHFQCNGLIAAFDPKNVPTEIYNAYYHSPGNTQNHWMVCKNDVDNMCGCTEGEVPTFVFESNNIANFVISCRLVTRKNFCICKQ